MTEGEIGISLLLFQSGEYNDQIDGISCKSVKIGEPKNPKVN